MPPETKIYNILQKQKAFRAGYDPFEATAQTREIPSILPEDPAEVYDKYIAAVREQAKEKAAEKKVDVTPTEEIPPVRLEGKFEPEGYTTAESTFRPQPGIKDQRIPSIHARDTAISQAPRNMVDQLFEGYDKEKETATALNQLFLDDLVKKYGRKEARERLGEYGLPDPFMSVFMGGAAGADYSMAAQLMSPYFGEKKEGFPYISMGEKLTHTLGFLFGVGIVGSKTGQKAGEVSYNLLEKTNLGTRPIHLITRAVSGAGTLATKTIFDTTHRVVEGDISAWDASKSILVSALYGTIFGTVGTLNSPFLKIPAEAATGYVVEKVAGGSDEDALFTALIFASLGLMNSRNLRPMEQEFAFHRLQRQFNDYSKRNFNTKQEFLDGLWSRHAGEIKKVTDQTPLWELDRLINKMKADWKKEVKREAEVQQKFRRGEAKEHTRRAKEKKDVTVPETPDGTPTLTPLEQIHALRSLGYNPELIVRMSGSERMHNILYDIPPADQYPAVDHGETAEGKYLDDLVNKWESEGEELYEAKEGAVDVPDIEERLAKHKEKKKKILKEMSDKIDEIEARQESEIEPIVEEPLETKIKEPETLESKEEVEIPAMPEFAEGSTAHRLNDLVEKSGIDIEVSKLKDKYPDNWNSLITENKEEGVTGIYNSLTGTKEELDDIEAELGRRKIRTDRRNDIELDVNLVDLSMESGSWKESSHLSPKQILNSLKKKEIKKEAKKEEQAIEEDKDAIRGEEWNKFNVLTGHTETWEVHDAIYEKDFDMYLVNDIYNQVKPLYKDAKISSLNLLRDQADDIQNALVNNTPINIRGEDVTVEEQMAHLMASQETIERLEIEHMPDKITPDKKPTKVLSIRKDEGQEGIDVSAELPEKTTAKEPTVLDDHTSKKEGTQDEFTEQVRQWVNADISMTAKKLKIRKYAAEKGWTDKQVEEEIESSLTVLAREIVESEVEVDYESPEYIKYGMLKYLYENAPRLTMRTSKSVELQQYSTPAPIAYAISRMAGIDKGSTVYEPTAGAGMLLIESNQQLVDVNEIDNYRADMLERRGYRGTRKDATKLEPEQKKYDVVVTNPPFGGIKPPERYEGYKISKKEHLIALKALEGMKDDGHAALILGANLTPEKITGPERNFLNYLYENYNVISNFEIDGKMYKGQGSAYPLRVVVIAGREKTADFTPVESKDLDIKRVKSWKELWNKAEEIKNEVESKRDSMELERPPTARVQRVVASEGEAPKEPTVVQAVTGEEAVPAVRGGEQQGTEGKRELPVETTRPTPPAEGKPEAEVRVGTTEQLEPRSTAVERTPKERGDVAEGEGEVSEIPTIRATEGTEAVEPANISERATALKVTDYQKTYTPVSKSGSLATVIPNYLETPVIDSLESVAKEVGDLDDYVTKKLGYKSIDEMHKGLGGEQVDGVALAIYNIDNGNAMIIGDQTGIGKGRQAAAIYEYAKISGRIPVFFTAKPNLYSDMYRDIVDIGKKGKPFMMGNPTSMRVADKSGKVLIKSLPVAQQKTYMNKVIEEGFGDDYDGIFVTYSQITVPNLQQKFLTKVMSGKTILIMDESHKASGQSTTGAFFRGGTIYKKGKSPASYDGILNKADGAVYLSATFAKRPDSMPLYFRTDMSKAIENTDELIEVIERGGVPLQQVVSSSLAKSKQMVRRERSFDGVTVDVNQTTDKAVIKSEIEVADGVTHVLRDIVFLDRAIAEWVEGEGGDYLKGRAQIDAGLSRTNFASVVHNNIAQLLLAIKADAAVESALKAHTAGKKPIITLEFTLGSMMQKYALEHNIKRGDSIKDFSYKDILKDNLKGVLRFNVSDQFGDSSTELMDLADLPAAEQGMYEDISGLIDKLELDIPASPIDYMHFKLQQAGLSTGELTSRKLTVKYTTHGDHILDSRTQKEIDNKNSVVNDFNEGKIDALILNEAGSTGISLHSGEKFGDQKPRIMITVQPHKNIDTHIQTLGRIFRTGQVTMPEYEILMTGLQMEKRPMVALMKKMKSLNANTTANAESSLTLNNVPDMMNKYGDQVVAEMLDVNPELQDMSRTSVEKKTDGSIDVKSGLFQQVTGRLSIVEDNQLKELYNEMEQGYVDLVDFMDRTGQNDLVAKDYSDWDAISESKEVLKRGTDESSTFTASTILNVMDVKNTKKAPTWDEAQAEINKTFTNLQESRDHQKAIVDELETEYNEFVERSDMSDKAVTASRAIFYVTTRNLNSVQIGTPYKITVGDETYLGVLMNMKGLPKKSGNPAAASKYQLHFIVADPITNLKVSLSQIINGGVKIDRYWKGDIQQQFDNRVSTGGREKRYVVTGNILRGVSAVKSGRIITFATHEGRTDTGILLPRSWNPKMMKSDPRKELTSPESAVEYVDAGEGYGYGKDKKLISPGGMALHKNWSGQYLLDAPLARAKGGKYYLDKGLRKIVGDFEKRGKVMQVRIEQSKALKALRYLQSEFGETFFDQKGDLEKISQFNTDYSGVNMSAGFIDYGAFIETGAYLFKDLPSKLKREAYQLGFNSKNWKQKYKEFSSGIRRVSRSIADFFNKVMNSMRSWYQKNKMWTQSGSINPRKAGKMNLKKFREKIKSDNEAYEGIFDQSGKTPIDMIDWVKERYSTRLELSQPDLKVNAKQLPDGSRMNANEIMDEHRRAKDIPHRAREKAGEELEKILKPLEDAKDMMLFERLVITKDLIATASDGMAVPNDVSLEELMLEHDRIVDFASKRIMKAADLHRRLMKQHGEELVGRGKIGEAREDYFPHKVLQYYNDYGSGGTGGSRLKEPFRPYTKARLGSEKLIKTDYLDTILGHLQKYHADNMYDNFVTTMYQKQDISQKLIKKAKELDPDITDKEALKEAEIPTGFQRIQPITGNFFYLGTKVRSDMLNASIEQIWKYLDDKGLDHIKKENLGELLKAKEALIVGEKLPTYIIPSVVAKQYATYRKYQNVPGWEQAVRDVTQAWKWSVLVLNPKYQFKNLMGDNLNLFFEDARAFTKHPSSIWQLLKRSWERFGGGKTQPKKLPTKIQAIVDKTGSKIDNYLDLAEEYGVIDSGFIGKEISDFMVMPEFRRFSKNSLSRGWSYVKTVPRIFREMGVIRENWARLAKFMKDLDRIEKGKKKLYGIDARVKNVYRRMRSIEPIAPNTVLAKSVDIEGLPPISAAGRVARKALIDYGDFSNMENRWLRNALYPFYSWVKGNTLLHISKMRKSPINYFTKLAGIYVLIKLWNSRDEESEKFEKTLPEWVRYSPHLNIVIDGKHYALLIDAPWSDAAETVGLGKTEEVITKKLAGEKVDLSSTMVESIAGKGGAFHKLTGGITPVVKEMIEQGTGVDSFTGYKFVPSKRKKESKEKYAKRVLQKRLEHAGGIIRPYAVKKRIERRKAQGRGVEEEVFPIYTPPKKKKRDRVRLR